MLHEFTECEKCWPWKGLRKTVGELILRVNTRELDDVVLDLFVKKSQVDFKMFGRF